MTACAALADCSFTETGATETEMKKEELSGSPFGHAAVDSAVRAQYVVVHSVKYVFLCSCCCGSTADGRWEDEKAVGTENHCTLEVDGESDGHPRPIVEDLARAESRLIPLELVFRFLGAPHRQIGLAC